MNIIKRMKLKTSLRNCDYILAGTVIKQQYYDPAKNTVINRLIDEYMENPGFDEALKLIEYNDMMVFYFTESCGEGLYVRKSSEELKPSVESEAAATMSASSTASVSKRKGQKASSTSEADEIDSPTLRFERDDDASKPSASDRLSESEEWMEQMIARMSRKPKPVDVKDFVSDRYKSFVADSGKSSSSESNFGKSNSSERASGDGAPGNGDSGSRDADDRESAILTHSSATSIGEEERAALLADWDEKPAAPAELGSKTASSESVASIESVESVESVELVDSVEPVETVATVETVAPVEVEPVEPAVHMDKPVRGYVYGPAHDHVDQQHTDGHEELDGQLQLDESAERSGQQQSAQNEDTDASQSTAAHSAAVQQASQEQPETTVQEQKLPGRAAMPSGLTAAAPADFAAQAAVQTAPHAPAQPPAQTPDALAAPAAPTIKHDFSNVIATLQIDIHAMSKQLEEYRHELSYYPPNDKQLRAYIRSLEAAIREFSIAVDVLEEHSL